MNDILTNFNQDLLSEVNISILSSILAIISSAISALVIRFVYLNYGRSLNNREYFGNIFMILAMTTCTVIIIVKYSLALSLGLVGALSIVRFRAAIKEPEELVYLFLVIALGLAFGANQFMIGFILLVMSILVIIFSYRYIHTRKSYDHTGVLIIISGSKQNIRNFRNNQLDEIIDLNTFTILKELEYGVNGGKIVLKASMNDELDILIERFEDLANNDELEVNIISDVSIPA